MNCRKLSFEQKSKNVVKKRQKLDHAKTKEKMPKLVPLSDYRKRKKQEREEKELRRNQIYAINTLYRLYYERACLEENFNDGA